MVIVVSIERLYAVCSPFIHNTRCSHYFLAAVFFSVTSNLPWFFQYKYDYDQKGNISGYTYTFLFLDKTFHDFWIYWQLVVHALIPFNLLIFLNFMIFLKLKSSSKQAGDEIINTNQANGLRRHAR